MCHEQAQCLHIWCAALEQGSPWLIDQYCVNVSHHGAGHWIWFVLLMAMPHWACKSLFALVLFWRAAPDMWPLLEDTCYRYMQCHIVMSATAVEKC